MENHLTADEVELLMALASMLDDEINARPAAETPAMFVHGWVAAIRRIKEYASGSFG